MGAKETQEERGLVRNVAGSLEMSGGGGTYYFERPALFARVGSDYITAPA